MKITLIAFAVLFLSASTLAKDSEDPEETTTGASVKPSTQPSTSDAPTSPSTLTPTTQSSTLAPTTSTLAPTTSTLAPTTSTAAPTTSTLAPTTSTAVPTTSTLAPTTSTAAPTTSTLAPTTTSHETTTSQKTTSVLPTSSTESPVTTPPPVPEPGYWNITEGNTTCIRASLAIRFKIEINGQVDYIELLPTASSEGSKCNTSDGTEVLVLKDSEYNVIFAFEKSSDNVYVKNTSFTYYLPFSTETFTNDSHFFEVKSGNSYLCKTPSNIILGNATMEVFSIHLQAFGAEHNKDFGSAEECGADSPIDDVVPIAVGVALLALVVVVLIAYLVGRRRSRQRGYQSV